MPAPPGTSVSVSEPSELFGCAAASSGGGLRSICESLLELSPSSTESALTRSERGGSRFGRGAGFAADDEDEPAADGAPGEESESAAGALPGVELEEAEDLPEEDLPVEDLPEEDESAAAGAPPDGLPELPGEL